MKKLYIKQGPLKIKIKENILIRANIRVLGSTAGGLPFFAWDADETKAGKVVVMVGFTVLHLSGGGGI